MLILERPWTRQPQTIQPIDYVNPLASSLGAFIHPGAGALEYVTQRTPSSQTATVQPTPLGKALVYSGTTDTRFNNGRGEFATSGPMTFAALIDLTARTGYGAIAACQTTTTSNGWELRIGTGATDGDLSFGRMGLTGYGIYNSGVANLVEAGAKSVFIAVVHNASAGTGPAPVFWVNGNSYTATLYAGNTAIAFTGTTSDLILGSRVDSVTRLNGNIHWAFFAKRALSDAELQKLRFNAYQLHTPQQIIIPTPAAATGYTHPTLSLATATEIGATSFKPRVTYTFA